MNPNKVFSRDRADDSAPAHQTKYKQRQHWNDVAMRELDLPDYYQSVAVLMVHWAEWLDHDLKCAEEVCGLTFGLLC
jgi:hypothetical protein